MPMKTKEAQREYQKEWVRKRREAYFGDKSCVQCGSTDRLELDHIDRATKVSHNVWSWSEARRNEELAKCQVLCYDCHKAKTKSEVETFEHGSIGMYHKGCKCEKCMEVNRERVRRQRRRHGGW